MAIPALIVGLDVASRLALPAALLALSRGLADVAVVASFGSALASMARGLLLGYWTERIVVEIWRRTLDAARRQIPATLEMRDQGEVTILVTAMREVAIHEAQTVPQVVALGIGMVVVAAGVAVLLGPAWLAFGALAGGALGALGAVGRRRLHRAYERTWDALRDAARETRVLLAAGVELRAHGREDAFVAAMLQRVETMSREERVATIWQAVVGLLPAGIAVAAVAGPVRAGAAWASSVLGPGNKLAEVGILGGTGLLLGFSLVNARERAARVLPLRRTLDAFLAASAAAPPRGGDHPLQLSLALAPIAFEDVSYFHRGASHATPHGFSHLWSGARGLALSGANGAGKSTLVLALLGLVTPTRGLITVDGIPLDEIDLADYRRRVAYLPQGAFVAPGESVAWHLRLFADQPIPDERMDAALEDVALMGVLQEHAARTGKPPRDVLAGELSGGERQRMHLCRVLLHQAEIVVLDEPEVALDQAGRLMVRGLLERLAKDRKVLVIAHDASLVPASFDQVSCVREQPWM